MGDDVTPQPGARPENPAHLNDDELIQRLHDHRRGSGEWAGVLGEIQRRGSGRGPAGAVKLGRPGLALSAGGWGSSRAGSAGVTAFDGLDSGPVPTPFVALTVKV
jgi:hypothetical protein